MLSTDFIDSKYFTLFINNGSNLATYWLSSRCVDCISEGAGFYLRSIDNGNVEKKYIYDAKGGSALWCYSFRPIISLDYDITLSGNSTSGWTIQ